MNPLLFWSRLCGHSFSLSPAPNCCLGKALASSSALTKDNNDSKTTAQWAVEHLKSHTEIMAVFVFAKSSWLALPMIATMQGALFNINSNSNIKPMNIKQANAMNVQANKTEREARRRAKSDDASEFKMNPRPGGASSSPSSSPSAAVGCITPQPELVDEPMIHPSVPVAFPLLYGKRSPAPDVHEVPSDSGLSSSSCSLRRVDSKEWINDFKNKKERIDKINFNNIFGGIGDAHNNEIPSLPPLSSYEQQQQHQQQQHPRTAAASPNNYSIRNVVTNVVPSSPTSSSSAASTVLSSSSLSTDLHPDDVICGRGGKANSHPGNISFRSEALKLRSWYESSSKSEKFTISNMLVDIVKERGGRFLKRGQEGQGWVECDGNDVRKKASQALREGKLKDVREGG